MLAIERDKALISITVTIRYPQRNSGHCATNTVTLLAPFAFFFFTIRKACPIACLPFSQEAAWTYLGLQTRAAELQPARAFGMPMPKRRISINCLVLDLYYLITADDQN